MGESINLMQIGLLSGIRIGALGRLFPKYNQKFLAKNSAEILDDFFFRALSALSIEVLVECGAREASASRKVVSLGMRAIAIEANPLTFERLTSAHNEGIQTLNVGLSDKSGQMTFFAPAMNPTSGSATLYPKESEDYVTFEVPCKTLDSVLGQYDVLQQNLALWVDVEGGQRQLITGGKKTFSASNLRIIKIEVERKHFFSGQVLAEELNDSLVGHGFVPVFCDSEYPLQFNVVYVREGLLDAIGPELSEAWVRVRNSRLPISFICSSLFRGALHRFLSIAHKVSLLTFGERNAHKLLALFGSASSQRKLSKSMSEN